MRYFRVKYGYGKNDFHSVNEDELYKGVAAQLTGRIATFSTGTIAGNSIIAITPDYNRVLGLNADWEMTGEDFRELPKGTRDEHEFILGAEMHYAKALIERKREDLIGTSAGREYIDRIEGGEDQKQLT